MDEYLAGRLAFVTGLGIEANPHQANTLAFKEWRSGWSHEDRADQRSSRQQADVPIRLDAASRDKLVVTMN